MLTLSDFIVREDEDGAELPTTRLPVAVSLQWWEDFDLAAAWSAAVQAHRENPGLYRYSPDREAFAESVRRQVANQDAVSIEWCQSCDEPVKSEEAESVDGGDGYACPTCFEEYYRSCNECGTVVHYDYLDGTLSDASVCESCLNGSYTYCEDCDGYYHDSDAGDHRHGGCDCEPPTLALTMRNGDAVIREDERVTITLPAGVISEEGINQIIRLIREHSHVVYAEMNPGHEWEGAVAEAANELRVKWWSLSDGVATMDTRWQTKEGNFTKRLSKLAHKSQGLKFPADLLTKVGNIARDQSNGAEVNLELTRNLNLPAEEFYHEDSCWWQSYSESRCALKSNGGIGMRTFDDRGYVQGRAWLMPLRLIGEELVPTFDTMTPDAYVVFNGYGDLSGYTPARIVAGMAGMTYRKIGFDCSPMYVNGYGGYIVAPEELAARYATSGLDLSVSEHAHLFYTESARQAESTRELATV